MGQLPMRALDWWVQRCDRDVRLKVRGLEQQRRGIQNLETTVTVVEYPTVRL